MIEGQRPRFRWTEEALKKLVELIADEASAPEIAKAFNQPVSCIENAIHRYGKTIPRGTLEENLDIPVFKGDLKLPMDDYLLCADYHSPYFSVLWHGRSLAIAEHYNIKKLVIIGDLLDLGFASYFYADDKPKIEDEEGENKRLIQSMLAQFEQIYLVKGNHEDRLGRNTDGIIKTQSLLADWVGPEYGKRFQFSLYDKLTIGDTWLCVHPKSYSQKAGGASRLLCSKYLKNIVNTHGHHFGVNVDPSGKYLAIDIGGMFDVDKISYINYKTTTHPSWNPGFCALINGQMHTFSEWTDFDFYLNER